MTQNRFWLEIVTLCATAALVLAFGPATLGASAVLTLAQGQAPQSAPAQKYKASSERTFSGVVSDSICTAKHDTATNQSAAGCTRVCLKKGAKYALVDGDKIYMLDGGTDYLDKLAGERVTVSGTLNGDTISVRSVDTMRR